VELHFLSYRNMMKSTWNARHIINEKVIVVDVTSISLSVLLVSFALLTLVNFRFYVQTTIVYFWEVNFGYSKKKFALRLHDDLAEFLYFIHADAVNRQVSLTWEYFTLTVWVSRFHSYVEFVN